MSFPFFVFVVAIAYVLAALVVGGLVRMMVGSPFDWLASLVVALAAGACLDVFRPLQSMVRRARIARRILEVLAARPAPPIWVDTLVVSYLVRGLPASTSLAELAPAERRAVEDLRVDVEVACERLVARGVLEPWTETFNFRATGPTDCVTPGLYRVTEAGVHAIRVLRERAGARRAGA